MEYQLPFIVPFLGEKHSGIRNVSKEWRSMIDHNDKMLLKGLSRAYPNAKTLHSLVAMMFIADDIPALKKLLIEYKGYLPVNWDEMIIYTKSVDANDILEDFLDMYNYNTRGVTMKRHALMQFDPDNVCDVLLTGRMDQLDKQSLITHGNAIDILNGRKVCLDSFSTDSLKNISNAELLLKKRLAEWILSSGMNMSSTLRTVSKIVLDEYNIRISVPTTPSGIKIRLTDAVRYHDIETLNRYMTKDNMINTVIYSFTGSNIPRWMYMFLRYKGKQWDIPLAYWIGSIMKGPPLPPDVPSSLWKKILATAVAHYYIPRVRHGAESLYKKYKNLLTPEEDEKIHQLSKGNI